MFEPEGNRISRGWRRLTRPSARWSVLALLMVGILIGFVAVVGTQVMVAVTGTNRFCGGACHSMQWVAKEHAESVHGTNAHGFKASCHDCHLPHQYPQVLWVKAKKGTKDIIGEMRGVISTEEKFKKERLRMAKVVWEEFKESGSQPCRDCHQFTPAVIAKQKEFARPMHEAVMKGEGTCIDCHKGVAHNAPDE